MDSALESWDSSGLEGNNVKANQRNHLEEPHASDSKCILVCFVIASIQEGCFEKN